MPMGDSQIEPGARVLSPGLFDAVLETELKRAVRGQNFVTLVVMDTRREWDGLMLSADEGTLTPAVRRLWGIAAGGDADRDQYRQHLARKYGNG